MVTPSLGHISRTGKEVEKKAGTMRERVEIKKREALEEVSQGKYGVRRKNLIKRGKRRGQK